jgi:hypothetical protein
VFRNIVDDIQRVGRENYVASSQYMLRSRKAYTDASSEYQRFLPRVCRCILGCGVQLEGGGKAKKADKISLEMYED